MTDEKNNDADAVYFIDRFRVPDAAREEFFERMKINRGFIRTLPGFVEDAAYETSDGEGTISCVTVAFWANRGAFESARKAVQELYRRQGFDVQEMFRRLGIEAERGVYTRVNDR